MRAAVIILVVVLVVLLTAYALFRDVIRRQPWAAGFYDRVEPIEKALWLNSRTILFARLKVLTGFLLTVLTETSDANLGAMLAPAMPFLSPRYQEWVSMAFNLLPMALSLMGLMDEYLRKITDKPIPLVAVTQREIATNPQIADAIDTHDTVTKEAVAEVEAARP